MKRSTLKILYFNHCFGTNAQQLLPFLTCHYWHFKGDHKKVRRISNIETTISLVQNNNPDIVVLSEISGSVQRKSMINRLQEIGFSSCHYGQGHEIKENTKEFVEIIIASKSHHIPLHIERVSVPPKRAFGGGMVAIAIPSLDCAISAVHLARLSREATKRAFRKQLDVLRDFVRHNKTSKRLLLLGDFNCPLEKLPSWIHALSRYSPDETTCSTTNAVKWLYHKNIDHILGRGFRLVSNGTIVGNSDHKAVYAVLTTEEEQNS